MKISVAKTEKLNRREWKIKREMLAKMCPVASMGNMRYIDELEYQKRRIRRDELEPESVWEQEW